VIPPLAHAGHWILYLAPVVVVLGAVIAGAVRERRRQDSAGDHADGPPEPGDD
jgi:hypothetical protein